MLADGNINETNFVLYAAKHYNNPDCFDTEEFLTDLKRFKYIKRLFNKYKETGDLRERLILNHIIIIYNVFGIVPATKMLFFRLEDNYDCLKPFLEFLGYLPKKVTDIGITRNTIICSDIIGYTNIEEALRKI
jgi:hypothetical protein